MNYQDPFSKSISLSELMRVTMRHLYPNGFGKSRSKWKSKIRQCEKVYGALMAEARKAVPR